MEQSLGVQLFWMIALGLSIGYVAHFVYRKRGVGVGLSLSLATAGAVLMGLITYFADFDLPLMYSTLGAVCFLFIANAFFQKG